jgi:Protein of unknown function (DUF1367)
MKIEMIKLAGGVLVPASDMELEKLHKFKTNEQYAVEIKRTRSPKFHRKVFSFFHFCFEHWKCDREFPSESRQFDTFRNHLTVIAGYYDELVNIHGEIRIEAKSLSYSSMSQEEFEELYNSLILAAMRNIFHTSDEETYSRLMSFF